MNLNFVMHQKKFPHGVDVIVSHVKWQFAMVDFGDIEIL